MTEIPQGEYHITEIGEWPADTWQPAIVKSFEENWAHATTQRMDKDGEPVQLHPDGERRLKLLAGKRILVKPCLDAQLKCACGALQVEVEQRSGEAVMPDWGNYGTMRPIICSEMLHLD